MIVTVAARILETMFVVGAVGCLVVLVLTGIEDLRTLFGMGEKE